MNLSVMGIAVAMVIGLALWWPRGEVPNLGQQGLDISYFDGVVRDARHDLCGDLETTSPTECQKVQVEMSEGPDAGRVVTIELTATNTAVPTLAVGDRVVLLHNQSALEEFRYAFADFQRATPMWILFGIVCIAIIALGRWQGVRALVGLGVSVAALMGFLLPSLIRGNSALGVALTGTCLIAFAALYLAHGINRNTTVALLGTLIALAVTTVLATVFVSWTHLTGLTDDSAQTLNITASAVSLRGLLIAGAIIGALGVLDDVTVTQVSAVSELHHANPALSRVELYRRAIRIGRDHIASTVNTLVLAYAGASLPLLLYFLQAGSSIGRVITQEIVAVEVIRTLVGSVGLVLSVPVTTALAVLVTAPRSVPDFDRQDDQDREHKRIPTEGLAL